MANEIPKPTANGTFIVMGITDDSNRYDTMLRVDPSTLRLKVDALITGGSSSGTQYDTNVAYADGDTGTLALVIRDDALSTLTEADGDYSALRVDSTGAHWVRFTNTTLAVTNSGTFAVQIDGAALTALQNMDTDLTTIISHVDGIEALLGGTLAVSNAELTELAAAINASNQVDVNIAASGATVPVSGTFWQATQPVSLASVPSHAVTNAGTFAVQAAQSGTWTVDLGATDNAVLDNIDADLTTIIGHVDGLETLIGTTNTTLGTIDTDTGNIAASVANIDTDTSTIITHTSNSATSLGVIDDWDNAASDGASVSGDVAHDSSDAGEPVKIGMKAYSPDGTTPGTAVAENDRTNAKGDLDGRLLTNDEHPRWWSYHADGSSALTDALVQADPGDGFQIVITNIVVSSGAATAMNLFLEEGSTKIFGPIYLEAVAGRGFCTPAGFKKHVTASTAVTVTTSAAIAHSVDIQGYIQAV